MSGTQTKACLSCRQRKLKCDRQQPCANCVSRSVECKEQLLLPANRRHGLKRPSSGSDQSAIPGILSRLDRIEAYIDMAEEPDCAGIVFNSVETGLDTVGNSVSEMTSASKAPTLSTTKAIQPITSEFAAPLGHLSTNDNILSQALMHQLSISVSADSEVQRLADSRHIRLPPKHETIRLFQAYFDYLGCFQRIINQPHSLDTIDDVYYQISHGSMTTAPRGLALILAVIAIGLILQPVEGSLDGVFPILKERQRISASYVASAMDCLEQHRRILSHSLENVQAMLILQFLINHIETLSPRYYALLAEALAVSHTLGLHLIDSATTRRAPLQDSVDPVTREMKRRVWWYLTSTDWLVSMVEGPFEAVYLVQPNRIASDIPRHINDADLGNPYIKERPLSEPTDMSYVLHRLKVAEVARCITDMMPRDPKDATCELILKLDSKIESLVQNLPSFFRVEIADSEETKRIDQSYPCIPMQRLLINFIVDLIRCRLHFPFLTGHPSKPLHLLSRGASLKAARRILAAHRDMSMLRTANSSDFMRIQGTVFHIFTGVLVLAADLCCNQPQAENRERQLAELMVVLRQLDGIKQHSQSADKFLETLTQLLVKYGVWAPNTTISADLNDWSATTADASSGFGHEDAQVQDIDAMAPFVFEELWDTFVERHTALDLIDM